METTEFVTIALIVFVPAVLLWVIFLARSGATGRRRPSLGIPRALRPGTPDDVLEGPRLERLLVGGVVATIASVLFIPIYWLPEGQRKEAFTERFGEESVERGQVIFNKAPPPEELETAKGPEEFKEIERGQALGQNCTLCHGAAQGDDPEKLAGGGIATFRDPISGEEVWYTAPPLNNVFTRWDEEVVEFTIKRGRPGTPMPAWGVEYGGPMTQQMVDDVMAWLASLPGNQRPPELSESCAKPDPKDLACGKEIFEVRCAVCHGPEGQGKQGTETMNIPRAGGVDDIRPLWYQGMALWKGDVRHLDPRRHKETVVNGRRFAFMPPFGEAPGPGVIPVPPYPLTDEQIDAVVAYERTL